jgi:hypothetical protein
MHEYKFIFIKYLITREEKNEKKAQENYEITVGEKPVLYECNYKRIESVELTCIHSIGALQNQRAYSIRRIGQVKISNFLSKSFLGKSQNLGSNGSKSILLCVIWEY